MVGYCTELQLLSYNLLFKGLSDIGLSIIKPVLVGFIFVWLMHLYAFTLIFPELKLGMKRDCLEFQLAHIGAICVACTVSLALAKSYCVLCLIYLFNLRLFLCKGVWLQHD